MKYLDLLFFTGIFICLYLPIAIVIVYAFNLNTCRLRWDGFTLKGFYALLSSWLLSLIHSPDEVTASSFVTGPAYDIGNVYSIPYVWGQRELA